MMTITQNAYERLLFKLADRSQGVAIRMSLNEGRVKFRRGRRRAGDVVFEHQGKPVLLLARRTAERIENLTLDAPETDEGRRLRLRRAK